MHTTGSTEAGKNWSTICDNVSRVRPGVIKHTHDVIYLSSRDDMLSMLENVKFNVDVIYEDDGSCTAIMTDMDLAENAESEESVLRALAGSILEYMQEYFDNYQLYSKAPNRRPHLPFITKAFLLDDETMIMEEMVCRNGRN